MERGNEAHSIGRPNLSRIARHRPDLPIVSPALAIRFRPPRQPVGGGLHTQTDLVVGQGGDVWVMNNWQDIDSCFGVLDEVLSTRCGGQGVPVSLTTRHHQTGPHRRSLSTLSAHGGRQTDGASRRCDIQLLGNGTPRGARGRSHFLSSAIPVVIGLGGSTETIG
jgi:hypothetical protein